MDIRPNKYGVDPLPFVVDSTAMPPLFQRWMFRFLNKPFFESLRAAKMETNGAMPPSRAPTLEEWVRAFNFTLTNMIGNGYMNRPDPKTATHRLLLTALTTNVSLKSKHKMSALQLNQFYERDQDEHVYTRKIANAFVEMTNDLDDEITLVQETRRLRAERKAGAT
jgi:hypothetical protein